MRQMVMAMFLLVGCDGGSDKGGSDDTGDAAADTAVDTTTPDTGPVDGPGDQMQARVVWESDRLVLLISDGPKGGALRFGLAETGVAKNGWFGEDCVYGDTTGTYFYCHPARPTGVELAAAASAGATAAGAAVTDLEACRCAEGYEVRGCMAYI